MNYYYKPKKVCVADLVHTNEQRVREKENVKNMFLERCHTRIASHNNFGRQDILFEIPPLVIGLPPYVQTTIVMYLAESLTEDGFYVRPLINSNTPPSLYISWRKEDVEKIKQARNGFMTLNKNGFFDNLPINPNAMKKS